MKQYNTKVSTKSTAIVVILLLCFVVSACMSELYDLAFEQSGKLQREYKVAIGDGRVDMKLRGVADYRHEYELGLYFRLRVDPRRDTLEIIPESLKVWYYDQVMQFVETDIDECPNNGQKGEYSFWARFNCPQMLDRLPRLENGEIADVRVRISYDEVFTIDGQPVVGDTVVAWERKAKYQELSN